MLIIDSLSVDYDNKGLVLTDREHPTFTWSAKSTREGAYQTAYSLTLKNGNETVYESGRVETRTQRAIYDGPALISGECYTVSVAVSDNYGDESLPKEARFRYLGEHSWTAEWITLKKPADSRAAKYFYRSFELTELPVRATLYACGIGYQYLSVNGVPSTDSYLNPAYTNYKKLRYYTVDDVTNSLSIGKNGIFAEVGDGWREMVGYFSKLKNDDFFFGETALLAELVLEFKDGHTETVKTDESWLAGFGAVTSNSLFDGETYDARAALPLWDTPRYSGEGLTEHAVLADGFDGDLRPQTLQPVTENTRLTAKSVHLLPSGQAVFDFGTNVAGLCTFSVPEDAPEGTVITLEYAEELLPDGDLDRKTTLRKAAATDCYIVGKENPRVWTPHFTYHGFRYVRVSGYPGIPEKDALTAIAFSNEIRNESYFRCGSALVNQLQENIVRTEMNNLHHIASDCPQRDERMGWMNDATVRFQELPYNFSAKRLFSKILEDFRIDQRESGSITDTAPFVWGSIPADPVCSSYLVASMEMLLHYGDDEGIRTYYDSYKRWNDLLASICNEEGIIEHSPYGDWAGPTDYCIGGIDGVRSSVTPGALMSTGFHYYNYKLLARFAEILGNEAEAAEMRAGAERVRAAFLKKWFDPETSKDAALGYVATGSQGSQTFALWLGILPKDKEELAAYRLYEAVKNVGYRLTTGNLNSKYIIDVLTKFGYVDAAWRLITREEYPSWGYMIANGATTVWERFENKSTSSMNSHDHPMYGAVGHWFYARLLGLEPTEPGWTRFAVSPVYPSDLLFAEAQIDTVMGKIYAKWVRRDGVLHLFVEVPFGTEAEITLPTGTKTVLSGAHHFSFRDTSTV